MKRNRVSGDHVFDGLAQIVVDAPAEANGFDDGSEVIVQQQSSPELSAGERPNRCL